MAFRTQKISQMTPKGANLEATDLIEVSTIESGSYVTRSITGQEIIDGIPPAAAAWGSITGTLSSQTDLQSALNAKQNTLTLTTTGTSGAATLVGSTLNIPQYSGGASGITIGTTAITSGTVGRILFEGTGNVVQESGNLFWDNTNGRLGIGTSAPQGPLDVRWGTGNTGLQVLASGSTSISQDLILNNTVLYWSGGSQIRNISNGVLRISDSTNANFTRLQFGGGTTSFPSLQRSGAALAVMDATGTALTNLLVGTTTDAGFRLDVNGTARINTLTIGLGTGQVATNSVFGFEAGLSNTTGADNVYLGYRVGRVATTASRNTFLGSSVGISITSASDCTGLGYLSLSNLTTGGDNTAVGSRAVSNMTTGNGNTGVGWGALIAATTGNWNVAIGREAGRRISGGANNTTTNNSIYIGYDSRANADNQTNQIVIGFEAIGAGSNTVTLGNTSIVKTILRGTLNAANLPTSPAGLSPGDIYNNLGVLMIV